MRVTPKLSHARRRQLATSSLRKVPVDFSSTPASVKIGMRSKHVTQSNGAVVQKSSIRKLPIREFKSQSL